jgi:hypothetical protein
LRTTRQGSHLSEGNHLKSKSRISIHPRVNQKNVADLTGYSEERDLTATSKKQFLGLKENGKRRAEIRGE